MSERVESKAVRSDRMELVVLLEETIRNCSRDPGEELTAMGEALIKCGKVLEGQSKKTAIAVLLAVKHIL